MQNMQSQEIVQRILAANHQQQQQQQYYLAHQLAQQQATPPALPVDAANQVHSLRPKVDIWEADDSSLTEDL